VHPESSINDPGAAPVSSIKDTADAPIKDRGELGDQVDPPFYADIPDYIKLEVTEDSVPEEPKINSNSESTGVQCDQCDWRRDWLGTVKDLRKQLTSHKNRVHKERPSFIRCDQCNWQGKSRKALKFHTEGKHDGIIYPCDLCKFTTKVKKSLALHKKNMHCETRFKCQSCDYSSRSEETLKSHFGYRHSKCLPCDQCDHVSRSQSSLTIHKEVKHLGVRHTCEICGETFSRSDAVNRHKRRRHSNLEKVLPCSS